jgi:hypothetical protein
MVSRDGSEDGWLAGKQLRKNGYEGRLAINWR